jgi:hypothetical protein
MLQQRQSPQRSKMVAVMTISRLQAKSNDDRELLLGLLSDMAEHCRTKESRIRRYLACIPVNDYDSNDMSVYTVEEYSAVPIVCTCKLIRYLQVLYPSRSYSLQCQKTRESFRRHMPGQGHLDRLLHPSCRSFV